MVDFAELVCIHQISILPDVEVTLQELTPKLHAAFQAQYSGECNNTSWNIMYLICNLKLYIMQHTVASFQDVEQL